MENENLDVNKESGAVVGNIKKKSLSKKILTSLVLIVAVIALSQIINASKYEMTVNVKDGENVMGINPLTDKLDFGDLSRNTGMSRYINIKSGGDVSTFVAILQFGEIADLVKPNKNFFVLPAGSEMKLEFEINIPPSAKTKTYSGNVWIFRLPKLI